MAVDANIQVLDLLFDDQDGVLSKEVCNQVTPLDFSDLDLFSGHGDLLENALSAADISNFDFLDHVDATDLEPKKEIYTDHDYFAQKSPANSDSGVSMSSSGHAYSPQSVSSDQQYSPRSTDQQHSPRSGVLSESPKSQSNLVPDIMDVNAELSPVNSNDQISALSFADFDMKDINIVGMDTSASIEDGIITDEEILREICSTNSLSQDTSLSFGTDTSLDEVTSTTATSDANKIIRVIKVSSSNTDTLPFTMKDISTSTSKIPELRLTDEEQELLAKEGVVLPTDMPLTKEEERILKAVRRKIRNKISAKESRKRKMTYVEGLEQRVKMCTTENAQLKKKCDGLEQQNQTLMQQLKKLQTYIVSKTTKPQTSTCVMVLLLSFAFLIVPNFNPFKGDPLSEVRNIPIPGKSRSLLHNGDSDMPVNTENDDNPYGLTIRPGPPFEVPPKTPAIQIPPNIQIDTVVDEIVYNSLSSEVNKTDAHIQTVNSVNSIRQDNTHQDVKMENKIDNPNSDANEVKGDL